MTKNTFLFRSISLSSVFTFLFVTLVQAQDAVDKLMPKTVMPSPTVAALGKYGSYPVSYFTGLPDISIPIFEAKSGSLSVPITLSYHASGVRYTDAAGWVGLGWSLSAGGQISRSVAGSDDEHGYINNTMIVPPSPCTNGNYLKTMMQGSNDEEPDVFSYGYPGKSGKFMLSQGGADPFLFPNEPIKVNPYIVPNHIPKIEITGEDGVLYRFGQNAAGTSAIEYTNSTNGSTTTGSNVMTAWHLMEMIAPNTNDKISFDYQSYGSSTVADNSAYYTVNDLCNASSGYTCPSILSGGIKNNVSSVGDQKGVQVITFEGGYVEFVISDTNRLDQTSQQLDQIKIYSVTNGVPALIKKVQFVYSYFKGIGALVNDNLRLKLDQVQVVDNAGTTVQQYTFTYFTNTFSWDAAILSTRTDLWGYYNGVTNTDTISGIPLGGLVPITDIPFQTTVASSPTTMTIGDANRSVNSTYLTEGMLKRIDFPTGGYTEFDFEPHKYFESGTEKLAGGARVSKITSYDGTGAAPIVKTYKYGNPTDGNESGYGVKNFDLDKFFTYTEYQVRNMPLCAGCGANPVQQIYRSRTYLSNSALSLEGNDGSPVIYPNVSEYYGNTTTNIGKVVYEFDNGTPPADSYIFLAHSSRSYRNSVAWQRGKMTRKTVLDQAGNKLTEDLYTYSVINPVNRVSGTLIGEWTQRLGDESPVSDPLGCQDELDAWGWTDAYNFAIYSQQTGASRQVSSTSYQYESGNVSKYVMKQSDLTYDASKLQVITSKENKSTSPEEQVSIMRYPFSYGTISGSATGNAKALLSLQTKNVVNLPVETYQYIQNSDGTNKRVISGQLTTFKEDALNATYIVPDQIHLLEIATPLAFASYVPSAINSGSTGVDKDGRYQSRINFANYDVRGNLLELNKVNDKTLAYIWGYSGSLPIAEVTNSDFDRANIIVSRSYFFNPAITSAMTGFVQSGTFTIDYTQNVTIATQLYSLTGPPTDNPYCDVTLVKDDGTVIYGPTRYYYSSTATTVSQSLTPGVYSYYYSGDNRLNTQIKLSINTDYQAWDPSCKIFHTSFEDNTGVLNSEARTGKYVFSGVYTLRLPTLNATNNNYKLTYFKKSSTPGGNWTYQESAIVINSSNSATTMNIGASGEILDEVRLLPATAMMTTYTYDPVLGITTVTSPANVTTYYSYDTVGRLMSVKDDKKKILKNYQYQFNSTPNYTNPEN